MSVATELTRIQSAKDALKTSIRNKGVSVSDNALISEYPALVDAIQTGGGGGDTAMKENVQGTLTSYTIPNDVTSIRNYAFAYLNNLESITISNGVTTIGDSAFNQCTSLTSVTIPNGVTSIGSWAFAYCSSLTSITIPNGVTSIGNYTFNQCSSLASIVIPDSVTTIGDNAFNQCTSLTSVTIPNGVTSIGSRAFYYCSNLTSVIIGNDTTEIGSSAFSTCPLLQTITIPSNVTSIGTKAFETCRSLKYIKFSGLTPPSIKSYSSLSDFMEDILVPESAVSDYAAKFPTWKNRIFADTHTHDYSVTELRYSNQTGSTPFTKISDTTLNRSIVPTTNLRKVYIGNNVTIIEDNAFYNVTTPILISEVNSLETIGASAFERGGVIGDLYLPNVTSIGNSAFGYSTFILSVTIGDRITSIGDQAFSNCDKLKSVTCLSTTPPTLGAGAFETTAEFPIYVPAESVDAYKAAAGWNAYASRIQAIPSV